jgi:hypothetical protein
MSSTNFMSEFIRNNNPTFYYLLATLHLEIYIKSYINLISLLDKIKYKFNS